MPSLHLKKITCFFLTTTLSLLAPKLAHADSVSDLFNTGVDASGTVLPNNTTPDPHYTIVTGIDGSVASPTLVHPGSVFYIAANTTSAFIQAAPATTLGAYDYQTTFTLPAGATNLVITAGIAVDNTLDGVLINGVNVGTYASGASLTNLTADNSNAFTNFNPISVTTPDSNLLTGTNTLTFLVGNDTGTVTGFRADSIHGTFTPSSSGTTSPEPTTLALLSLTTAPFLTRRRK